MVNVRKSVLAPAFRDSKPLGGTCMNAMSQIDELLDPRLFKAFLAAAETENFTAAATVANMTQSGVSQHVAKLEEQIQAPLFKRLGKTVKLTETGRKLKEYIEYCAHSEEDFLESVRDEQTRLKGLVSYAMPPSCLLSPHFPMLLGKRKNHPDVELRVHLLPSARVLEMVADGEVDFGFVTQKTRHPMLTQKAFCQEEYILVGWDKDATGKLSMEDIVNEKFIHYPGSDVYYDFWLRHHANGKKGLDSFCLPCAGWIDNIDGAIKMVEGHLGYGVFPRHCVDSSLADKKVFEFKNRKKPLLNDIYITQLRDHKYPRRVEQVIDWFMEMAH